LTHLKIPDKTLINAIVKVLPLVAFVIPLTLLYLLNPFDSYLNLSAQDSFQLMWKGRTFLLFFVWLIALELLLSWDFVKPIISKHQVFSASCKSIALILPSIYLIAENWFGLNSSIADWAAQSGVPFSDSMPLAFEYIFFSVIFCFLIFAFFGKKGLRTFILPTIFVAIVGLLYSVDNIYPYGQFTPFQLLVPTTTMIAASILNAMGYNTVLGTENSMPTLQVSGSLGTAKFAIAWPCAGIESLLIFMAVSLIFLKRMTVSWKAKTGFFAFGATVTYLINLIRIVTIFTIGMEYGVASNQVQLFHFYYGPLYAMAWIISYPLILLASIDIWKKIKKPRSKQLNLV
jgi:thaumarchaeosortase